MACNITLYKLECAQLATTTTVGAVPNTAHVSLTNEKASETAAENDDELLVVSPELDSTGSVFAPKVTALPDPMVYDSLKATVPRTSEVPFKNKYARISHATCKITCHM